MASLLKISSELLYQVFENLVSEGRPSVDLVSLRLVCRRFSVVTERMLFLSAPAVDSRLVLKGFGCGPRRVGAALANIGRIQHPIESLTIGSSFGKPWSRVSAWGPHFEWSSLLSLTVMTRVLAKDVLAYCTGRCSRLRRLHLLESGVMLGLEHTFANEDWFQRQFTDFLGSVQLKELSLLGYQPKFLDGLATNGHALQSLAFHCPKQWSSRLPLPVDVSFQTTPHLTEQRMTNLQIACPSLAWLAIDVESFHLAVSSDGKVPYPHSGHATAPIEPAGAEVSPNPVYGNLGSLTAAPIFESICETHGPPLRRLQQPDQLRSGEVDPVFTALTHFSSLRHLRLFIHPSLRPQASPDTIEDAILTFIWLRSNKRGAPLESLVIMMRVKGPGSLESCRTMIVYEMGEHRVYAEGCGERAIYDIRGLDELSHASTHAEGAGDVSDSRQRLSKVRVLQSFEGCGRDLDGWTVPLGWHR